MSFFWIDKDLWIRAVFVRDRSCQLPALQESQDRSRYLRGDDGFDGSLQRAFGAACDELAYRLAAKSAIAGWCVGLRRVGDLPVRSPRLVGYCRCDGTLLSIQCDYLLAPRSRRHLCSDALFAGAIGVDAGVLDGSAHDHVGSLIFVIPFLGYRFYLRRVFTRTGGEVGIDSEAE